MSDIDGSWRRRERDLQEKKQAQSMFVPAQGDEYLGECGTEPGCGYRSSLAKAYGVAFGVWSADIQLASDTFGKQTCGVSAEGQAAT
jgi:hypothetical protein